MRKIFLFITVSLFLTFNVYAFGNFQLLDFSSLPYGISGQPYITTVNFVYSGNWVPDVSLVGENLPSGIKISNFYVGKNGVGSFKLIGTPSGNGSYKINILLTDNNGAVLLKTTDFFIEDGSDTFKVIPNLPNAFKGVDYRGQIIIDYLGEEKPDVYYSGIPSGIFINRDDFPAIGRGTVQLTFYGVPTRTGNYPISFKVWNGKENEVNFYSIKVEDSAKSEVLVLQTEQKEIQNTIKTINGSTKANFSASTTVATPVVQINNSAIEPVLNVENKNNEDISFYKKIKKSIKAFLFKIVNNI